MQRSLFDIPAPANTPAPALQAPIAVNAAAGDGLDHTLDQFFTPTWAAERIVEHFFPDLTPADFVVEPSCGHGAFLGAIPDEVPALGIEIDDRIAAQARINTGREVITGDFLTVDLPRRPTALIGNPPFNSGTVQAFLGRAEQLMEHGGRVGLILPAYIFQTSKQSMHYAQNWSLDFNIIPRTLFPNLSMPLCFTLFTKSRKPLMKGFFLMAEMQQIEALEKAYQEMLARAPRSSWAHAVAGAVRNLGGRATLQQIYCEMSRKRPSETPWWREKVRQVAQRHLTRVDDATYALAA